MNSYISVHTWRERGRRQKYCFLILQYNLMPTSFYIQKNGLTNFLSIRQMRKPATRRDGNFKCPLTICSLSLKVNVLFNWLHVRHKAQRKYYRDILDYFKLFTEISPTICCK